MYRAIFYQDLSSYNRAKTAPSVIESSEPLLLLVTDDTAPIPGDQRRVKNSLLFTDLDVIPTNKAIIRLSTRGGTFNEQANAWLKANNAKVLRDLFNMGIIIVELPRGTFDSFASKIGSQTWCAEVVEDALVKADLNYAFTYEQHWHLGNIGAQESWNLMDPYASNTTVCDDRPRPNVANSGTRDIQLIDCCDSPEIALIDSGVQVNHPDLAGRLGTCGCDFGPDPVFTNSGTRATAVDGACTNSWNIVNDNNDVNPQSSFENHGTAMAGIISGNNLNNNYTLSVSNNYVKTQVLRTAYNVSNNAIYTTPAWVAEALYRASQNTRCAAVVICWGISTPSAVTAMQAGIAGALDYVRNEARECTGIPVFVAAGNNASTNIPYPASDPNTLAIGAAGSNNLIAPFSNRGSGIFAAAPGVSIRSTDRTGTAGYSTILSNANLPATADVNFTNLAQHLFTGTSASAAIAGAVAGCMRAVYSPITASQIENILSDTALPAANLGAGVIRMEPAIEAVIDLYTPTEDLTIDMQITSTAITVSQCNPTPSVVAVEIEGSGDTWNLVQGVFLEYFISADQYITSNDLLAYSQGFPINNITNTYTTSFTLPNTLTAGVYKLIVRATFTVSCGQLTSDGAQEFITPTQTLTVNSGGCPGTDLGVEVLSWNITNTGLRVYQIKYTNTGTVPITSFTRSYGWVAGASATNTVVYNGTTGASAPLQPGQSRIVNVTFTTPAPQLPAIYFHQINTVNGVPDFNPTNNYSTIVVNS